MHKKSNYEDYILYSEGTEFDYSFRLPSDTGIEVEDTEICDVNEERICPSLPPNNPATLRL